MDHPRSSAKASTHSCSMRDAASVAGLPLHRGADGAVGMQGRVLRRFFFKEGNKSGVCLTCKRLPEQPTACVGRQRGLKSSCHVCRGN